MTALEGSMPNFTASLPDERNEHDETALVWQRKGRQKQRWWALPRGAP
jgi:hypothetical protein